MRQCRDDALSPTPVSFSPGVGKCKHKYAISHQLDGLNQQGCRRNHWQFEASICYWEDSPHFALSRALDIFEVHVLVGLSSPGSSWLNCAPCSRSSDSLVSVGTLICQSGAVLLFCFWVFSPPASSRVYRLSSVTLTAKAWVLPNEAPSGLVSTSTWAWQLQAAVRGTCWCWTQKVFGYPKQDCAARLQCCQTCLVARESNTTQNDRMNCCFCFM